jgi:hypothetical protein
VSKEGIPLPVHKLVLAPCVSLKRILLANSCCRGRCDGGQAGGPTTVLLPDIPYQLLSKCVDFLYKGRVHISTDEESEAVRQVLVQVLGVRKSLQTEQIRRGEVQCPVCSVHLAREGAAEHMVSRHVLAPAARDLAGVARGDNARVSCSYSNTSCGMDPDVRRIRNGYFNYVGEAEPDKCVKEHYREVHLADMVKHLAGEELGVEVVPEAVAGFEGRLMGLAGRGQEEGLAAEGNLSQGADEMSSYSGDMDTPSEDGGSEEELGANGLQEPDGFSCRHCRLRFTRRGDFVSHEQQPHLVPCASCGLSFTTKIMHEEHLHLVHMVVTSSPSPKEGKVCGVISLASDPYVFPNESNSPAVQPKAKRKKAPKAEGPEARVAKKTRRASGPEKRCRICRLKMQAGQFRRHVSTHLYDRWGEGEAARGEGRRPCQAPNCGKVLPNWKDLVLHLATIHDELAGKLADAAESLSDYEVEAAEEEDVEQERLHSLVTASREEVRDRHEWSPDHFAKELERAGGAQASQEEFARVEDLISDDDSQVTEATDRVVF